MSEVDLEGIKLLPPFQEDEEDLEWLELGDNLPTVSRTVFDYSVGQNIPDPVEELINIFIKPDYITFTCRMLLGVELLPYQALVIDTLWNRRLPMLIGSRGAGKSFLLAVYCLLRMILHPGCNIVIVGSGLRQSRQVFDYMATIWEKAPILRDIAGKNSRGPRREIDRFQFEIGDSHCFAIPLGDGSKIRGLRANYIIADEFATISEEIFNLVVQGFAIVSDSLISKVKEAARVKRLKKDGKWNDDMEAIKEK
jgi:hypothetical protein